jgi:type II secretory pathway pseudopilin PulG
MTLIELLVVIVILTTIVAAAIPLISPSNDDRRLRETARGLNTYITGAQTRAIATNRPWGVAFKRLSQDTKRPEDRGVSLEAYYVEQQPPYAGFDANSRACVALHPNRPGLVLVRFLTRGTASNRSADSLPDGWDADLFPPSMIRPHDVIQVGGTRYELLPDNNPNDLTSFNPDANGFYVPKNRNPPGGMFPVQIVALPLNDSGQLINPRYDNNGAEIGSLGVGSKPPAPYWTLPAPYKIYRQPTPASDEPYQLPEGTAIDLRASGVGSSDYFYVPGLHDNDQNVIVLFAPEGRVSKVNFSQTPNLTDDYNQTPVDNLYLLVGRRENSAPADVKADPTLDPTITSVTAQDERDRLRQKVNWLLGNARWIVIGSQSGRIVTEENAAVDMASLYTTYTNSPNNVSPRSEELRNKQIQAAREFTREMSQMGGR